MTLVGINLGRFFSADLVELSADCIDTPANGSRLQTGIIVVDCAVVHVKHRKSASASI